MLILWKTHNQNIKSLSRILKIFIKDGTYPPGLAAYLNKYLVNHISEKILQEKPVSWNIKNVKILDEYIKEPFW